MQALCAELGAVVAQKQDGEFRVMMYASRSLTAVERRYSQDVEPFLPALNVVYCV